MRTRSQELSENVFKKVKKYKEYVAEKTSTKEPNEDLTEYGSMAHKLPILIHHAGLAQAIEFVRTRDKESHKKLLEDLSRTLGQGSSEEFAKKCRECELIEYIHLTQRALEALQWYKRFAKSVLGVEANSGERS